MQKDIITGNQFQLYAIKYTKDGRVIKNPGKTGAWKYDGKFIILNKLSVHRCTWLSAGV